MEAAFEKQTFGKRLKSMLKADLRRMLTAPLAYIFFAICLALPILILVMTAVMPATSVDPVTGAEKTMETFTNVWQAIGSVSGAPMGMDLTSMCNINMIYFVIAIFVCIFVAEDFKSGYAKNLFAVRAKKTDYVISKTVLSFACAAVMCVLYFIGAMLGGAIAGLSFSVAGFGAGGIVACMFSKIFLTLIFVSIAVLLGTVGKQRLWLSIFGSLAAGMLLFTMLPMISPLDSDFLNVIMCAAGGGLFAVGLGAVSNLILNKTGLV